MKLGFSHQRLLGGLVKPGAEAPQPPGEAKEFNQLQLGRGFLWASDHAMDNRYLVGVVGQPHWLDSELAALARQRGHAEALREVVNRRGLKGIDALQGRFAALVIDGDANKLYAAVDRIGQETLYWADTDAGLYCAHRIQPLAAQAAVDTRLSAQGIFYYTYFHMLPAPATIYQGVSRLQAGQRLIHDAAGSRVEHYWLPRLEEPPTNNLHELESCLLETVNQAVGRASADQSATGAFLSGGLDSSTVAGVLAQQRPGNAPAFSIGFDAEGYDEMAYARAAARHFQNQLFEYYVTPSDVVAAVPEIAAFMGEPFGNSSALPALYCARFARDQGISLMLAGDGGDELFAGNARYAKQRIFEVYGYLPAPARQLLETLVAPLPALGPVRKLQSYIQQARVPLPDRLQSYNFLHRLGLENVFTGDFLAQVNPDEALTLQRDIYTRPEGNVSSLNRMLYQDWQQTLADNDLRKVVGMADLAGVSVAFPLLDDAVVAFSTKIPSALKLKGTRLRHFYRQSLRNFLPEAVLRKSKHGFGLPFGVWMRDHQPLQELAYDSLQNLIGRGYFQRRFVDDLIERHRSEHAAYYGEAVWILMMLELWLQHHQPRA